MVGSVWVVRYDLTRLNFSYQHHKGAEFLSERQLWKKHGFNLIPALKQVWLIDLRPSVCEMRAN
jgi:hypothetical protein